MNITRNSKGETFLPLIYKKSSNIKLDLKNDCYQLEIHPLELCIGISLPPSLGIYEVHANHKLGGRDVFLGVSNDRGQFNFDREKIGSFFRKINFHIDFINTPEDYTDSTVILTIKYPNTVVIDYIRDVLNKPDNYVELEGIDKDLNVQCVIYYRNIIQQCPAGISCSFRICI